jgi:cytochrome c biogenesis protein CcmG/thiol:disulfide interchange protein DsbE
MRKIMLLLLGALLITNSWAASVEEQFPALKIGSETYTKVTVTSVTATDLYFTHSRGIGTAKLKDLEPAMQQHFHFDPAKAAARQAEQAQGNALYTKNLRESPAPSSPAVAIPTRQAPPEDPIPPHKLYAKSFLNLPAPEISVEKWLSEPPDMQGKFVLVDFWATWCGPCRESIPHLNQLSAMFKDKLVVIGLSKEPEQKIRAMTSPKIEYTIASDTQGRTSQAVEVRGIPHTILIDPTGIVRFEGMPHYLDEKGLETLIAKYSR